MTAVGSDGMEAFCCPMCLDLLEDPLILNCGDTMCSRCVAACIAHECASILASQSGASAKIMGDDPWNSQKQPSAGVPNDTCTTKSASEPVGIPAIVGIKCARCSMITNVPIDQGIKSLKPNRQLADILQQRATKCTNTSCIDCGHPATSHCTICGTLCDSCWIEAHKRPSFASHPKLPVVASTTGLFSILCVIPTNNVMMCSSCARSHKGHPTVSISEQAYKCRSELESIIQRYNSQREKIDTAARKIEKAIQDIKLRHVTFQEEVDCVGASLISKIQEQITSLKSQSMSLCSTSVENLGRQYSVLNAISSNLRDLSSRATTSSKEPSDILLINSQMTFSKAVQQLEYQDEVNPCESGDFFSKLDCSDVSRAIAQVGFIIPRERATGTPRDVACIESSNTSLALQWLPPQPVSFVPLAELPKVIGYTVFVKSGAVATAVQHSTEAPSLHISNLPKGTTHNVCVRAEYSDFHGTCSPEYTFATPSALQFKFISDWDTAGIIYYLGTKYRHQSTFQNPHTLGLVQASWSRTGTGSPENVLSRNWQFGNQTGSSASSWWQIDLRPCGAFVRPTKYSLRHDCNASNFLRLWELRASRDGESWTIIASHLRDRTLCEPHGVGSWDISRNAGGFSIFRVVMTGPCSNGNNKLFLSGFEIYGELEFVLETAKSL